MMNETGMRRILPDQSSGSGHTFGTPRHPGITDPILSKRVCFYKSGDPQFNGLRMVINNRTFKTFDALLDSLSKKVPLPFGVRNITTPRGVHAIYTLDELEDGKSYICSDRRKVKPINLAVARKKLPPWYHARPVSSRRRTVQQARFHIHKQEPVVVRLPKRLLVFRNGDPTTKQTVVLHKRSAPTFESVLEYISQLIQFHVVKLHTLDGRRVDGLPGLILCSGTVVAAGREPFRPASYDTEKSPAPTRLSNNRTGLRRLKALHRKKQSLSNLPKARHFSPSSERYIVNRIRNSIVRSSSNILSNPTNSDELESAHMLESVAETEGDTRLSDGAEGPDCLLPTEDDIEKSFRVNQDGSMTVEMRVRLTIKEEETIHWTTTLTRSSAAGPPNDTCLPEQEELESISLEPNSLDLQMPVASVDTTKKDKNKDDNDQDPPSLSNGVLSDSSNEERYVEAQADAGSPTRAPTPAHEQIRKKQTSVESIKPATAERVQEGVVGSYSYRERMENGATTEKYCMLKQSTTRPVPKPRRLGSVDANPTNLSSLKSAEILQIESSEEEITETVLHIYERQMCQDNFLANLCAQDVSAVGFPFDRPATSETGRISSESEFQPEVKRPQTASESMRNWRAEILSSDFTLPSLKTGTIQTTNRQQLPRTTKGNGVAVKEGSKDKRALLKVQVLNKRAGQVTSPGKRQKEKRTKVKTFSSAGFIRRIYGNKSKSPKKRLKKRRIHGVDGGVGTKRSQTLGDRIKGPNIPHQENTSETGSPETRRLNGSSTEVSQPKAMLTRQASVRQEKGANEYVQKWLEKSHPNPTACSGKQSEALTPVQLDNRNNDRFIADTEDCQEEKSDIQTVRSHLVSEGLQGTSVKLRVQSFENKSSQLMEKNSQSVGTNTENCTSVAQTNTEEIKIKPISSNICSVEMKSSPIKISQQKETLPSTCAQETPVPPPAQLVENMDPMTYSGFGRTDESPVLSSPLCKLSSVSSHFPDNHPLSMSPESDQAGSPSEHSVPVTSVQSDKPLSLREPPLPRTPSIKRAPLVSNLSLERKMSLRKACLDKYTSCSDATSQTSTSSSSINTLCDIVPPKGNRSTVAQHPGKILQEGAQRSVTDVMSSPSGCTSEPPTTTSDERMSSTSISSNETPTHSNVSSKETETPVSNQAAVKKVKLISSPSTMRRSQSKKLPSNPAEHPPHNAMSPSATRTHAAANASPSTEKRPIHKPKLQKRQSPYSQSLDLVSPPVRNKPIRKMMSRNLSSDNAEAANKASSQGKHNQTPPMKAPAERDKTLTCENDTLDTGNTDQNEAKLTEDLTNAAQQIPLADILPLNSDQANMKPVLDKICYSIKSIRQITQNKRLSCLEKSNSMPDFSSHVASTFGSSSKVLLAFLSVMTLKECLTNFNMDELDANSVSCAEALKMIDSLREIACIEDSQKLTCSLSDLQQSASKQLLQSWKGFQELSDKCKSRSSTPNYSEYGLVAEAGLEQDCGVEENVINELMDNLHIPERLKEELVSFPMAVKSEREKEENMSARIIKKLSLNENRDGKISHSSTEDPVPTWDITQDETANVDVRSIIKKFVEINQAKDADLGSVSPKTAKSQEAEQATEDEDSPNVSTQWQTAESDEKEAPKRRQLYSTELPEEDNRDVTKFCRDEAKENNLHQGHIEDELNKGRAKSEEKENLSCSFITETQHMESRKLQMYSEETMRIPENKPNKDEGSEEEDQNMSSVRKDAEDRESCKETEPEPEFECEDINQENSEGDSSNLESNSEEENKRSSSSYYVELNFSRKETTSSPDSCALSNHQSPFNPENEQEVQKSRMGLNVSVDESTEYSGELCSSEEEQLGVEHHEPKVATEESLSALEEEQESVEVEEHLHDLPTHEEEIEPCNRFQDVVGGTEEDKVSHMTTRPSVVGGGLSILIENQDVHAEKEKSSLIKSEGSSQRYFNADEDSGNDHSSCEDQDVEQTNNKHQQMSSSIEEELSYDEKESSFEEEPAKTQKTTEQSCEITSLITAESDLTKCDRAADQRQSDKTLSQSVAERVSLLEKQAADAQRQKTSAVQRSSQRAAHLETDVEDSPSESPTSQSALCTRSAPQSSLAFSYDSSGVITTEPEGNRVRSIREMFLAKSAMDVQQGNRRFPSPNPPELSELRAQTSGSGGYQSQTSSDVSSGEDDSARKSITKGFVRRTIERLYGKKNANPDEEAGERSLPEPKQKKKEHSSIFSPFHSARSKAMSELSYFSSTNALDTLSEATRCIAFNAQVGPGDSERWLLRENTLIRKSVSDPVGIHKTVTNSAQGEELCEDANEKTPYSLFSTKPEQEDKKSLSRKCTYFSLPHGSDSDACQDEQSVVNADATADVEDNPEDTKTWAERSTALSDFKRPDNKVHPLTEVPSEVVVVQPRTGQGVVNRRLQEPDALDLLYNFCGQHCPIL